MGRMYDSTSAIPNFILKILPDDEITEEIDYLNSKERNVFNVVHTWVKNFVKYNGHHAEPVHVIFLGKGGTGKSHFVKVIHNTISKLLRYHSKNPEKLKVNLLGPTEISAVDICGTTIYTVFETKKKSAIPNVTPTILPDNEIIESINSLNSR